VKFIADAMLGKFTRWLRMLGQDVTYSTLHGDKELLMFAKAENRVLLTKDFELYKRATVQEVKAFFSEGKSEPERIAEVAKRYDLKLEINMNKANCPICNNPLKAAPKEQIKEKLENHTYSAYNTFWHCSNCGQVYWQGAHWKQISKTLAESKESFNQT
jgi:uncharacterized protein